VIKGGQTKVLDDESVIGTVVFSAHNWRLFFLFFGMSSCKGKGHGVNMVKIVDSGNWIVV
jgi:hypothetical protein